jgi:hypothetical protein
MTPANYFAVSLLHSKVLKAQPVADVIVLACQYPVTPRGCSVGQKASQHRAAPARQQDRGL